LKKGEFLGDGVPKNRPLNSKTIFLFAFALSSNCITLHVSLYRSTNQIMHFQHVEHTSENLNIMNKAKNYITDHTNFIG